MPIGDLFWADLPESDGVEQSGRRPVVLFQDDSYGRSLRTVLIVPLTSNLSAIRFPGTVSVPASNINRLTVDSIALVFQLRALDRRRLVAKFGMVEQALVSVMHEALDRLTGRPRQPPPVSKPIPSPPPTILPSERTLDI